VRYSSGSVSLSGRVADLSWDGLFVESEVLDSAGASAQLAVALPGDNGPLELLGTVVRIEGPPRAGMGIRLTDLARGVRRRLANYMIERSYQTRP
jgi:hypothetical protein